MDAITDGWFSEVSPMWPGQAFSLEVEEVLHDKRSEFQHVQVFRSKAYGVVLVLDGIIQATERDEFAYQEMMTHLPLMAHPNPKKVLVVGGGDGGVLREVVKHPSVESVTLCEIDKEVVEAAKKFLPTMAVGFTSPKTEVVIGDGCEFMRNHKAEYDVIITDSSDPIGPAEMLFTENYYTLIRDTLRPGGIACSQAECLWLHTDLIVNMMSFCRKLYPVVDYAYVTIPSYPCGQIGIILCSKDANNDLRSPRPLTEEQVKEWQLRYYNSDIHRAAFLLPQFIKEKIARAMDSSSEAKDV